MGYGAYAQVWLTYNHKKKDFYALKVQHPDDFDEAKDEIKILTKVRKLPYCVQLIESFVFIVEKKQKYNVMVFPLYGINLHDLLKKKCFDDGMPEDMVEKFTKQTLMNLDMLHNKYNLIHCDLKPDNFLLSEPNYKIKKIMESYNKDKFNGAYDKIKMELIKKGGVLSKKEDFIFWDRENNKTYTPLQTKKSTIIHIGRTFHHYKIFSLYCEVFNSNNTLIFNSNKRHPTS